MKATEEQQDVLDQLMRYFVAHRPSENMSVHRGPSHLFTQLWPGRVPTGVYVRMKQEAGLAHDT